MADTFYVSCTAEEAVARIRRFVEDGSFTGELLDCHRIFDANANCIVLVLEKWFYRVSNRLTLTVTVDDFSGRTRVHFVSGGGGTGTLFNFDWGAADSFENEVYNALGDVKL